jgi:hypothetical protein
MADPASSQPGVSKAVPNSNIEDAKGPVMVSPWFIIFIT